MKNFAEFRGYICTANPDGSIPLKAQSVCFMTEQNVVLLRELIAQANLAHDLRMAMSEDNTRSAQFKDAFTKFEQATDVPF